MAPSVKSIGPSVGCNVFRSPCASLQLDVSCRAKRLSRQLGHADPGFTLDTHALMDAGVVCRELGPTRTHSANVCESSSGRNGEGRLMAVNAPKCHEARHGPERIDKLEVAGSSLVVLFL